MHLSCRFCAKILDRWRRPGRVQGQGQQQQQARLEQEQEKEQEQEQEQKQEQEQEQELVGPGCHSFTWVEVLRC